MAKAVGPVLLLFLASACAPSIRGAPHRLLDVPLEIATIGGFAGPEAYNAYAGATGVRKRELRDQILLSRMYAIDLYYSEYEMQLTRERQNVGFWTTVANLALTGTATAITPGTATTALSAVATGLTGAREAYEKDILIEKTIAILQQQMRARRKQIKTNILDKLTSDIAVYPLELALGDLENYYRAGTITGALIDVAEETGFRLATARAVEEQVVVTRFAPVTELGRRIQDYAKTNRAAVTAYLDKYHSRTPLEYFIRYGSYADQLKMLQYLQGRR